jgi:hypothetical protein
VEQSGGSSDVYVDRWQSFIDRMLEEAHRNGDFSNLLGAGKPLKLDDLSTPEHLRMAYKILRDNDLAPEWMLVGKELEERRALLLHDLQRAASKYHEATRVRLNAERTWKRAQMLFRQGAQAITGSSYNLKLPPGIAHKTQLDIEGEISRALSDVAEI